ncbi:MAG: Uma2 family endonuclease [Gemmataceae bacterium]
MAGFGSMTFKRRRKCRGLEPDECYWIQSVPAVRGKQTIDLKIDPPPDLVVEIEWTRSALDRLSIYAAMGVPEVWQYDGQQLRVKLLGQDGKYVPASAGRTFPFLPLVALEEALNKRTSLGEIELVREFRAWVRGRIAANWQ